MIPKKDLKKGSWYIGSGRGSHVAIWDGESFLWPAMSESGPWSNDSGAHYEEGGCFLPMEEIQEKYPTMAQVDWQHEREKKMTAEDLWKVIEKHCGAEEGMKNDFIRDAKEALDRRERLEYRFKGLLGFGGKLWLDMDGRARVSCYSEDETPERVATMATANKMLQRLSGR
jgi:hypothetical protein